MKSGHRFVDPQSHALYFSAINFFYSKYTIYVIRLSHLM